MLHSPPALNVLRTASCALFLVLVASSAQAESPAKPDPADKRADQTTESTENKQQAAREARLIEALSGKILAGHFTIGSKGKVSPKEEKYTITKLSKIAGDTWLFQVRIQYGDHDVNVPLPLPVKWAGDTPVITVDKIPVPGLGTYSARVLIFDRQYAGTWSGANHGGHLFGRIEEMKKKGEPVEK